MQNVIIETDRTFIVYMDLSHIDLMINRFQIEKKEASKIIQENIEFQKKIGVCIFNVFEKKSEQYLGYCGCNEIELKNIKETQLSWSLYKEYKEDNIDIEVAFAVRNYVFKHTPIQSLVSIIPLSEPQNMNIAEAIDMENDYSFFVGFKKFFVYVVNRQSQKFKASYGDGESNSTLTSSLNKSDNSPNPLKNFKIPRPRPK